MQITCLSGYNLPAKNPETPGKSCILPAKAGIIPARPFHFPARMVLTKVVCSSSRSDSDPESETKGKNNWLKSVKLAGNKMAGRQEKLAGNHTAAISGRPKWSKVLKNTTVEPFWRNTEQMAGNAWNMTGSVKSLAGKQQDDWAGKSRSPSRSRAAILRCESSNEALEFLAGMPQPTGACICVCICVCIYAYTYAHTYRYMYTHAK
jgi:hypothetical protein